MFPIRKTNPQQKEKKEKDTFHARTPEHTLADLGVTTSGLSNEEALARTAIHGPNELSGKDKNNPLLDFVRQFKSVLVYILLTAAGISYIFDHKVDTYVILFIVVANALIGFVQEYRAQQSIAALKKSLVQKATVLRSGEMVEVEARELVPGDVIIVEAGMFVPADARIIECTNLDAVESSLTGESLPVHKQSDPVAKDSALADQRSMLWMGTMISKGVGRAVVVATGNNTTLGAVAEMLEEVETTESHFQQRARTLAIQMGSIAIATTTVIFFVGFFVRDIPFDEIFFFAIAALVSGIPEGLPAILSIVLAVGAYRISRHNALVRTLPSAETLGVTTTIVTDKTGTLTQNVMMVEQVVCEGAGRIIKVSGVGWESSGEFLVDGVPLAPLESRSLSKLLHIAGKGTSAHVSRKEQTGEFVVAGDPTEAALSVLAHKAGLVDPILFAHERVLREIPFSSETKRRATLVELREQGEGYDNFHDLYVVGAPESVIAASTEHLTEGGTHRLSHEVREHYLKQVEHLSHQALRVIALAYRTLPKGVSEISDGDVGDLVLVGLVGMKDPVRPEVPDAVARAHGAGIRVIMATGDHKATAFAIAKEVGIISDHNALLRDSVVDGVELETLSDVEFLHAVKKVSVFARLEPKTKLRIARALQGDGEIVAMTGDGVNDALALKQADIGIAMGKVGTDVARQSSDIVLTDDNFASIIDAVAEGRTVFTNTRQTATFLVSTSFAEHATILGTMFMGLPLPLLPTQILWLNLVTDGAAGAPLSLEPGHPDILKERPRKRNENILSLDVVPFLIVVVGVMAAGTLYVFTQFLSEGIDKARTGAFAVMAFTQFFNMFNVRSLRESVFRIGLFSNRVVVYALGFSLVATGCVLYLPFFQRVFHFVSLSFVEMAMIIGLSSFVLWLGEVYKFVRYRAGK